MKKLEVEKISIRRRQPLLKYPNDNTAQAPFDAYIRIAFVRGLIYAVVDEEPNSTDTATRNGHVINFRISSYLTKEQIDDLIIKIYPLAQKLYESYEITIDENGTEIGTHDDALSYYIDKMCQEASCFY